MSKRIVIVERCTDCLHYVHALTPDGLSEGHGCMFDGVEPNLVDGVSDNCPLPEVPEREDAVSTYKLRQFAKEKGISGAQANGWKQGWNACLDEIEGGGEDE